MKEGWSTNKLSEVIIRAGTIDPRKEPERVFHYIDVSSVSRAKLEIAESSEILGKDAPSRARRLIREDDVLFATIRPTLKRVAVVPKKLDGEVCSTGYFVFRTKPELDNKYLFYYLLTDEFMERMERLQSGASYPAVNDSQVKQQKISYPHLEEQKRIVAILDEAFTGIDSAIANTEKNLANVRELFECYLNSVFTKKGDGWSNIAIGDVAQVKGGKRVPKGYKPQTEPTNHPYITVSDFNDTGSVDLDKIRYIGEDVYKQISRYTISSGDLYISIAGTIGKSGIIPKELEGANLTENACKLVLKDDVSNRYLYFFTRTDSFREQAIINTRTAAQPKLALERLKTIRLSIPSIEVQGELVEQFNELWAQTQSLESIYQQKLNSLKELKQSLLQKAFSGELTAAKATTEAILKEEEIA